MKNKKIIIGILLVVLSAFCSSLGQLIWKLMSFEDEVSFFSYFIGLAFYGVGALLLIISFKFGEMSILHPMLSFGFVFAIIWSSIFLTENITVPKLVGTLLIIVGVIVLAIGNSKSGEKENYNGNTN